MKKYEMLNVFGTISNVLSSSKSSKLNWVLINNKKLIEKEKEAMDEYLKDSDDYKKYDEERIEVCKKFCLKDDNGVPVLKDVVVNGMVVNKEFDGLKNNNDFHTEMQELDKKWDAAIKERSDKIAHYNEVILNEETDVDSKFKKINAYDVPDGVMTGAQQEALFSMVTI